MGVAQAGCSGYEGECDSEGEDSGEAQGADSQGEVGEDVQKLSVMALSVWWLLLQGREEYSNEGSEGQQVWCELWSK